jgi:hypothetical protein
MGITTKSRNISRAVCDGTGLSQEEIGLLLGAAAAGAALLVLLRTVDALVDLWPPSIGRAPN